MKERTVVYLVWVRFRDDGAQAVAAAYLDEQAARDHLRRSMTRWANEDTGEPEPSCGDILGIGSMWIERLEAR